MEINNFYPRSPCGERHILCAVSVQIGGFLSTLSLRRATANSQKERQGQRISIHALLAESDVEKVPADVYYQAFLSTLSLRRATKYPAILGRGEVISIHALLAESDHFDNFNLHCVEISIHALLAESDSKSAQNNGALLHI